jgi:thioredoxin-related protein
MRSTLFASLFALAMLIPPGVSRADLGTEMVAIPTETWELIVVESEYCIYCDIFRRDVLPSYEASEQGKQMPVEFIDVNDVESAHLDLKTPVNIVPTFVVMKSRHEVGRIAGYVGPENFFHSINYLLAAAP